MCVAPAREVRAHGDEHIEGQCGQICFIHHCLTTSQYAPLQLWNGLERAPAIHSLCPAPCLCGQCPRFPKLLNLRAIKNKSLYNGNFHLQQFIDNLNYKNIIKYILYWQIYTYISESYIYIFYTILYQMAIHGQTSRDQNCPCSLVWCVLSSVLGGQLTYKKVMWKNVTALLCHTNWLMLHVLVQCSTERTQEQ